MTLVRVERVVTSSAISKEIDLVGDAPNNKAIQEVAIQVIGTCKVALSGKVCDEATNEPISAINLSSLTSSNEIADNNVYIVPTEALSAFTMNVSNVVGTATIVAKCLI